MNPSESLQQQAKLLQSLIHARSALTQVFVVFNQWPGGPMPVPQSLTDACDAIDKATNDVAAEIQNLSGQISTGMTQADVDSIVARLNAQATKLEGIAADPGNPVPAPTTGGATPPTP